MTIRSMLAAVLLLPLSVAARAQEATGGGADERVRHRRGAHRDRRVACVKL